MTQSHKPISKPRLTTSLLRNFTLRHWRLFPVRTALLLLLLSIGVAVFLSIRLANRAAISSFDSFAGILSRQTDAVISSPSGVLPESVLDSLRSQCELAKLPTFGIEIIPVAEALCTRPRENDSARIGSQATFTLLGLDLVALQNLAAEAKLDSKWLEQNDVGESQNRASDPLSDFLQKPNAAFCSKALAQQLNLHVGDAFPIILNDRAVSLEIAGIIPTRADQPQAPSSMLVMDLPRLQEISGKNGLLDRVELVFPTTLKHSPNKTRILANLRDSLGPSLTVRTPESREAAAEIMTRGFRLNLTILSLIALLVGLYLIFQALDAAVVRRKGEIAVLRALGVREWEVRTAWLWEAGLLGLAGGVVGVLGGWALAQITVRAVSKTVNALYYANNAQAANLRWDEALYAFLLSVGCSIAAGWLPAKRAASTPPAQVWAQGSADVPTPERAFATRLGLAFLLAAILLALLPPLRGDGGTRFALAGYASALLGVLGAGLVAGDALKIIAACIKPFATRSPALQLANSHLRNPSSRHRWATAALLCAVSMTGGMAVLVGSFERSVSTWIGHTLQADLFVTSDANQAASAVNRIPQTTWRSIVSGTDVADWDTSLIIPVELPLGRIRLVGSNLAFARRHNQLVWVQPPRDDSIYDTSHNSSLCAVSESFAMRFRLQRDDSITLPSPSGMLRLKICGVYTDYGDDQGLILVDGNHLAKWFLTDAVTTLCVTLKPGLDPEHQRAILHQAFPGLAIFTNVHLRAEVMRIFRQTFAITYALEAIGVVVALLGLGITLASILAERKPELTTLRALGMSSRDLAKVAAWEGTLLATAGTLGGIFTSLGLGTLLIFVINKQTFGWTLQPVIPWLPLLLLGLSVPVSGCVVAWIVGRRASELPTDRVA